MYSDKFKSLHYIQTMSDQDVSDLDTLNLDYYATASLKKSERVEWALDFELKLTRKIPRSIIEKILPSAMLVMVSWVKE